MAEFTQLIYKYLRHEKKFPHVWCPGCGNGIVLGALIRAIDRIGLERHELSKRAKDLGSAAVFVALVLLTLTWGTIFFVRFVR